MPRFNRLYLAVVVTAALVATAAGIGTALAAAPPQPKRVSGASVAASPQPHGVSGPWRLVFDDEFNGNGINERTWLTHDGWVDQNNVTDRASNIRVSNGDLSLKLSSRYNGAAIASRYFLLRVGDYAEARIKFAGTSNDIFNWPAWWTAGPGWPASGENDIAEGFGDLTVNYHSSSGTHNHGSVPGDWGGTFHTYGVYRGPNYSAVYWDGHEVKRYRTDDDGGPERLVLTIGVGNAHTRIGPSGAVVVDYVRAWHRS